ncbi:MAG: rod-binding protein [Defluviitaleaceae bacterium]|nr:rod-binding protein [Defluviitaleaceae bacterium]
MMMDISHIQNMAQFSTTEQMSRRLTPAQYGMSERELQDIKDAAEAFESYFLQIMLREMRRTIPEDQGFIPTSTAERIFTEMLDEEMAKDVARSGGIGLSKMIIQQLTRDYASNMR